MKTRRAFTLIELLIVVAIIAILASIAMVNYSQATVRAKSSALKNDLRITATALEAYVTDNGHYPPSAGVGEYYNEFGYFTEPVSARMIPLTTPIAYVSSVPVDPFRPKDGWGSPDLDTYDTFDYVDADAVPSKGSSLTSGADWRISSAGPDLYQAYGGRTAGDVDANQKGVDYDPTNGTTSAGDIVRVGPPCSRYGNMTDKNNPNRPGILRAPAYVEQF
jgi:prepilin-type N-terminal cleavage/methylation domain-containing protein